MRKRRLYRGMFGVAVVYILYVTFMNFIHDPQAAAFLSHKVGLKRTVNTSIWLPVMMVHIVAACIAMLAGAVNFSNLILTRYRSFHRANGYLYVIAVILVDITSGYMAPYATGGKMNSMAFNFINFIWLIMTIAAVVFIKRKQLAKHRKWMIRSYVFCYTNLFIHLISFLASKGVGLPYVTSYTIGVYGAIVINILLAEWIIRRVI
ncbi:DUF2306 domain-containing protein [Paenibacillus guangzhouensis]|uniref:DUF2306 domain-containing protein n=1 Tax=Paenibacillus guangzhouensis TaxID=1473112 RepID=UPI00126760A5|nr:DUF2306 domain-containing protein [Paenibacillus guangzhouensis]